MSCFRIAAILTFLILGASTPAPTSSDDLKAPIFRTDTYKFTMTPPAFKKSSSVAFTTVAQFLAPAEDGFAANLNVQVHNAKFEDFNAATETQFKANSLQLMSTKDMKIGGHAAREYVYKGFLANFHLKFIGVAIERGDTTLLMTATSLEASFDKYEPIMRAAINSIHLDD